MTKKEIVKTWFAQIDAKNFDAIRSLMAANHSFHNPMTPSALDSEGHIGMMQQMTSAWDGEHICDIVLEDGNYVVVKGRWAGKHVGEFNGIAATGNQVEFTWTDIFEFENGKVTNEYFEMNPMTMMAQIGAMDSQNA